MKLEDIELINEETCKTCDLHVPHHEICLQTSTYAYRNEYGVMVPVSRCPKFPYKE